MLVVLWVGAWSPARSVGQCCGDCNEDGKVEINELVRAVSNALGQCENPVICSINLLVTGQTKCWDTPGNEIDCAGSGQDAEQPHGAARSYTNNEDGTITDNATGLMWEVKDEGSGIHDLDNEYTWEAAFAFVRGLNVASFAGYTDWRLPNLLELESLNDLDRFLPAIDPAFNTACTANCTVLTCSCTRSNFYWSSSTWARAGETNYAWTVDISSGQSYRLLKGGRYSVRAVRNTPRQSCILPGP